MHSPITSCSSLLPAREFQKKGTYKPLKVGDIGASFLCFLSRFFRDPALSTEGRQPRSAMRGGTNPLRSIKPTRISIEPWLGLTALFLTLPPAAPSRSDLPSTRRRSSMPPTLTPPNTSAARGTTSRIGSRRLPRPAKIRRIKAEPAKDISVTHRPEVCPGPHGAARAVDGRAETHRRSACDRRRLLLREADARRTCSQAPGSQEGQESMSARR
jgi:hypothetical protein